jgi:hypothetical protein
MIFKRVVLQIWYSTLVIIAICLVNYSANAQNRFYAGVQAGPKLSFSNTITNFRSSTSTREGWQAGLIGGINLTKRLSLETGFLINRHRIVIDYEKDYSDIKGGPDLWYKISNIQIPLLLKARLLDTNAKFKLNIVTGVAYSNGGLGKSSFYYFKPN